jgi:hypothetical protein
MNGLFAILSINGTQHNYSAGCHILFIVMMNVIMLIAVLPNVIMVSVTMLNVIMASVTMLYMCLCALYAS